MKIIFIQVKRHIDNPARLISMCLVNDNITMNREWKIKMYKNDH